MLRLALRHLLKLLRHTLFHLDVDIRSCKFHHILLLLVLHRFLHLLGQLLLLLHLRLLLLLLLRRRILLLLREVLGLWLHSRSLRPHLLLHAHLHHLEIVFPFNSYDGLFRYLRGQFLA